MARTSRPELNEDIYEEISLMLPLPDALSLLLSSRFLYNSFNLWFSVLQNVQKIRPLACPIGTDISQLPFSSLRSIGRRTAAVIHAWRVPEPIFRSVRHIQLMLGDRFLSVIPGTQLVITESTVQVLPGAHSLTLKCWDFATGREIGRATPGGKADITHISPKSLSSPLTDIPGLFVQALVVTSFDRGAATMDDVETQLILLHVDLTDADSPKFNIIPRPMSGADEGLEIVTHLTSTCVKIFGFDKMDRSAYYGVSEHDLDGFPRSSSIHVKRLDLPEHLLRSASYMEVDCCFHHLSTLYISLQHPNGPSILSITTDETAAEPLCEVNQVPVPQGWHLSSVLALPEPKHGLFIAWRSINLADGLRTGMFGFGPFQIIESTQDSAMTSSESNSDKRRLIPVPSEAYHSRAYDTELKTRSTAMGSSGTHVLLSRYQRSVIDARPFLDLLVYHPFDAMIYDGPQQMPRKKKSMLSIIKRKQKEPQTQEDTLPYSLGPPESEGTSTADFGPLKGKGCSMHRLLLPREVFEPRDINSPKLETGGFHFDDRLGIVYILRDDGLVYVVHYA